MACKGDERKGDLSSLPVKGLAGFLGNERQIHSSVFFKLGGIEFSWLDGFTLMETLGQVVRPNKRGLLSPCHNTILERLSMNNAEWLKLSESFGGKFRCAVGSVKKLENYALHTNRAWVSGQRLMSV